MYSTNAEYRKVLRTYFHMDTRALEEEYAELKESDPESYDEYLYDDDAMKKGMDDILENTRANPQFIALYKKAAGQFLSEDLDTGLCVLLTFDYFADFIQLYENPTEEGFQVLLNKL
jgi:hypothetical protein